MKKILMFLASAAVAVSATAQTTTLTSFGGLDNIYVGGALGAQVKSSIMTQGIKTQFNPNVTLMVGKNLNPYLGLRLEGEARLNCSTSDANYPTDVQKTKAFVNGIDVNLLGTFNLSNLFCCYKDEPRDYEFIALYGFGWGHMFGRSYQQNSIISKVGVDIAYNFGKQKQYQVFLEPSLTYDLQTYVNGQVADKGMRYNWNNSNLDVKVGFIYKLPCSNGKHNFARIMLHNQSNIDYLNNQINGLREDANKANAQVAENKAKAATLQQQLTECQNKPVGEKSAANLEPSVIFQKGSSVVRNSQMPNIELIANYMKQNPEARVKISGYASPEGSPEVNQKLSEKRAAAVKDVLVKRYKIAADRLETEGLGATDKVFQEVEFNRVALFNDTAK